MTAPLIYDILAKKTQERIEHHLLADGLDEKVHGEILADAASLIHDDTLMVVGPTDVQKRYAEKMPYLAKVWDGSEGKADDNLGYTLCMAIAFENDEVCWVVGKIASTTSG